MKDLKAVLSPLKVSGNLICTVGVLVAGAAGCFEVLIFGLGAVCLGCSSLLLSSSLVSVSYLLLLGATVVLDSILNAAGLNSLLVGLTCLLFLHLSLGDSFSLGWADCTGDCLSLDSPGCCAQLSLGQAYQCAGDCLSVDCPVEV